MCVCVCVCVVACVLFVAFRCFQASPMGVFVTVCELDFFFSFFFFSHLVYLKASVMNAPRAIIRM